MLALLLSVVFADRASFNKLTPAELTKLEGLYKTCGTKIKCKCTGSPWKSWITKTCGVKPACKCPPKTKLITFTFRRSRRKIKKKFKMCQRGKSKRLKALLAWSKAGRKITAADRSACLAKNWCKARFQWKLKRRNRAVKSMLWHFGKSIRFHRKRVANLKDGLPTSKAGKRKQAQTIWLKNFVKRTQKKIRALKKITSKQAAKNVMNRFLRQRKMSKLRYLKVRHGRRVFRPKCKCSKPMPMIKCFWPRRSKPDYESCKC